MPLQLMSRPGCHLCDLALALLAEHPVAVTVVDIEPDLKLVSRYGDRVPVLVDVASGRELGWPMDENSLGEFLANTGH